MPVDGGRISLLVRADPDAWIKSNSGADDGGCETQAAALTDILKACGDANTGAAVTDGRRVECREQLGVEMVLTNVGADGDADAGSCQATAAVLSAALTEFRGPFGTATSVECLGAGFKFTDAAQCQAAAATMNAMTAAHAGGGFKNCEVTTPTTTPTTTTTQTTSGTSTATSTPTTTTTPITTPTSSPTTTTTETTTPTTTTTETATPTSTPTTTPTTTAFVVAPPAEGEDASLAYQLFGSLVFYSASRNDWFEKSRRSNRNDSGGGGSADAGRDGAVGSGPADIVIRNALAAAVGLPVSRIIIGAAEPSAALTANSRGVLTVSVTVGPLRDAAAANTARDLLNAVAVDSIDNTQSSASSSIAQLSAAQWGRARRAAEAIVRRLGTFDILFDVPVVIAQAATGADNDDASERAGNNDAQNMGKAGMSRTQNAILGSVVAIAGIAVILAITVFHRKHRDPSAMAVGSRDSFVAFGAGHPLTGSPGYLDPVPPNATTATFGVGNSAADSLLTPKLHALGVTADMPSHFYPEAAAWVPPGTGEAFLASAVGVGGGLSTSHLGSNVDGSGEQVQVPAIATHGDIARGISTSSFVSSASPSGGQPQAISISAAPVSALLTHPPSAANLSAAVADFEAGAAGTRERGNADTDVPFPDGAAADTAVADLPEDRAKQRGQLMDLASAGNENGVRRMLKRQVSVNFSRKKDGADPLYLASANGHTAVVKLLIEAGANANRVAADGTTAFDVAASDDIRELFD